MRVSISIDGIDIRDMTKHSLRSKLVLFSKMCFYLQERFGKILRMGREDASEEKLMKQQEKRILKILLRHYLMAMRHRLAKED